MKQAVKILWICGVLMCANAVQLNAADNSRVYKFWVEFKDKNGSPYSILRPWDFLSEKALSRRVRAGYTVNMTDLPVNRNYISGVSQTGVSVKLTSRWMNGVLVSTHDSTAALLMDKLSFVTRVTLMGIYNRKRGAAEYDPEIVSHESAPFSETQRISVKNKVSEEDYNFGYGLGWKQISMMKGQYLHNAGFKGEGISIAVLDAGFYRANMLEAFDGLFNSNRFLGSMDLVDVGSDVFNDDDHGTQVLSCLASNVKGVMIGTAPNANYLLIRTEDAGSETPAEEVQWLCGAEYADSMGIDIISSSLGYTEFDNKAFGHHYNELDGKTTLITRAANMAWERGIVVVNSAGNEGDGEWKYIGAPADAAGVIAVGSIDEYGDKSDFSSFGPSADNRIKPDMVALGQRTTVVNTNGYFIKSNGTSYSAPVLAGSVACLMQANPDKSLAQIKKILMLSTSDYLHPNSNTGHGMPNFDRALELSKKPVKRQADTQPFSGLPVDTLNMPFQLQTLLLPETSYTYRLLNAKGNVENSGDITVYGEQLYAIEISPAKKGKYTLVISDGDVQWKSTFYFLPKPNKEE